jgi:hypothetical protein
MNTAKSVHRLRDRTGGRGLAFDANRCNFR